MKKLILILLISTLAVLLVIQLWNYSQHFINTNKKKVISQPFKKSSKYHEEILSEDPRIVYIHNFLTNQNDLDHLISLADELKKKCADVKKTSRCVRV